MPARQDQPDPPSFIAAVTTDLGQFSPKSIPDGLNQEEILGHQQIKKTG